MSAVPEEVVAAVLRAATAAPDHPGDLAGVRRRWRVRRRRRAVLTAGSVACLVAATATGVPLLTAPTPGSGPTAIATGPNPVPPVPPQRLLLSVAGITMYDEGGQATGLDTGGGVPEIRPDGSLVRHPVPNGWTTSVGLPDGGLVGLRAIDRTPGGTQVDGPDAEGLSIALVVLRPDGSMELSREVRIPGETVALLGATSAEAYLLRADRVVRHDLATGRETVVLRADEAGVDLSLVAAGDLSGRFLALYSTGPKNCWVRVFDLADGRLRGTVTGIDVCPGLVRLSPNGQFLAVAMLPPYGPALRSRQPRLTIFETATGAVRAAQVFDDPRVGIAHVKASSGGLAWIDDHDVQVARVVPPVEPDRIYQLDEVLRISTVSVPGGVPVSTAPGATGLPPSPSR